MPNFDFCIPTRGITVTQAPDWLHEIKYDGYRLRVELDGDRVRLFTRNGYGWTKRYPSSSLMFATLIPLLADRSSCRAGLSRLRRKRCAARNRVSLHFDHLAQIVDDFTQQLGLSD
jgi:hypothetical protein